MQDEICDRHGEILAEMEARGELAVRRGRAGDPPLAPAEPRRPDSVRGRIGARHPGALPSRYRLTCPP